MGIKGLWAKIHKQAGEPGNYQATDQQIVGFDLLMGFVDSNKKYRISPTAFFMFYINIHEKISRFKNKPIYKD